MPNCVAIIFQYDLQSHAPGDIDHYRRGQVSRNIVAVTGDGYHYDYESVLRSGQLKPIGIRVADLKDIVVEDLRRVSSTGNARAGSSVD